MHVVVYLSFEIILGKCNPKYQNYFLFSWVDENLDAYKIFIFPEKSYVRLIQQNSTCSGEFTRTSIFLLKGNCTFHHYLEHKFFFQK